MLEKGKARAPGLVGNSIKMNKKGQKQERRQRREGKGGGGERLFLLP
jgi:hypothetical protein